ncbi:MAG: hypothetical protein IPM53_15400 [Anaerolineaceae bacterium]|nr:hypothetical protein [Anaerolineaceae bacterium]
MTELHYWSVWYPKAASTGLLLGRGLMDPTERLLVHAAPPVLTAEIHDENGRRLAYGKDLAATASTPMCLLQLQNGTIDRQDLWPGETHHGLPVLLPGGEVGILQAWWHAEDRKEWRWQVEFYNSLRE